jgi:hypothetical protein
MKTVDTPKGKMWQGRLYEVYDSYSEFAAYSSIYGIAAKLGFENHGEAWRANPIIRGSVNPEDLQVVPEKGA